MGVFVRNPVRVLPDGSVRKVFPFHVSTEGTETRVFCRCNRDYDDFVKIICICAWRSNVILVMYAVVSNHVHAVILASGHDAASAFAESLKKMFSMNYTRKYGGMSVMSRRDARPVLIDSDRYLRNAIAYDIKNALDNSISVSDYRWTAFGAMFCGGDSSSAKCSVKTLSKREKRRVMHSNDKLNDVPWLLDEDGCIVPVSVVDWRYAEAAFYDNHTFFLKSVGVVDQAEMRQKLILNHKVRQNDSDFVRVVDDISLRWFSCNVHDLPQEKKARLISFVWHSFSTSPSQLARVFEIPRDRVAFLLGLK